jgi:hypothetical protein
MLVSSFNYVLLISLISIILILYEKEKVASVGIWAYHVLRTRDCFTTLARLT